MFLQLGEYKFEGIKLPQSWNNTYATNYAQIPIIDGKPVVQKTGEKLVEIELTAEFRDEFCVPTDEVEALQLYRRNGNVLQLTGGDGINYGKYIITDISVINTRASDNGYVSAIQTNIKLLEYNTTKTTVLVTGEALKSSDPIEEEAEEPMVSLPLSASIDIQTGISKANEIKNRANALQVNYAKISNLATEGLNAFNSAYAKIENTKKIIYRAINLQNTIRSTANAIQSVKSAADIHDMNSLLSANTELGSSVYDLKGASAPLNAFIGSREGGS
jgi:phage protein U